MYRPVPPPTAPYRPLRACPHSQNADQECPPVRLLLDDLGSGLAGPVARFGLDADQDRRRARLRRLQGRGELERVAGYDTVVVVGGGDEGRRVARTGVEMVQRRVGVQEREV